MKDIIEKAAAVIAAGLMFTACAAAGKLMPPEPKVTGGYSADIKVTSRLTLPDGGEECEFAFGGRLRRYGAGFYELSIGSPETLAGMKVTVNDGDFVSSLGGLSFDIDGEDMPKGSPVRAVISALDGMAAAFDNGDMLSAGQDGGWVYQAAGVSAVFDGDGQIVSLACGEPNMQAEFTGFTAAVSQSPDGASVTERVME